MQEEETDAMWWKIDSTVYYKTKHGETSNQ